MGKEPCIDMRVGEECIYGDRDICDACGRANNWYGLNLDDLMEELYCEMEKEQDGKSGHHIAIKELTPGRAVDRLLNKIKPFLISRLYLSDENGYKKEASEC